MSRPDPNSTGPNGSASMIVVTDLGWRLGPGELIRCYHLVVMTLGISTLWMYTSTITYADKT
jgi:hypothetical protein